MPYDAFLNIEGIQGEATDQNHLGWIEISSFSWGVSNPGSNSAGGGGGSGKSSFQDLHCESRTSKASPNLMLACAIGKHIGSAVLSVSNPAAPTGSVSEFMKLTLEDCLISSYQNAGAEQGDDRPLDAFSLNFVKIDFMFTVPTTGEVVESSFSPTPGTR